MENDKNMLGDFLATVVRFVWKLILWAAWSAFRIIELAAGGMAAWIKKTLAK